MPLSAGHSRQTPDNSGGGHTGHRNAPEPDHAAHQCVSGQPQQGAARPDPCETRAAHRPPYAYASAAARPVTALTFLGLRHIAPTTAESGGGHSHGDAVTGQGSDEGPEGHHGGNPASPPSQPAASPEDAHPSKEPGPDDGHQH